ncbi:unnamed protein product [Urochloa decumbens]|uniref:Uncharacterized protein n=2 Tax=Urochloa decumbens TaxID=240449 RepID=A0ABC9DSD4_9POAL
MFTCLKGHSMAPEAVSPLLEPHEGSSRISSLLRKAGKVGDFLILLLVPVGVVYSTYLLASPASGSVCVTMNAPDVMKNSLLLLPVCLIIAVLSTSGLIRELVGGGESRALSLVQAICGVMLLDWLAICMCGASAGWVLATGAVLAAAVVGWAYMASPAMAVEA